MNRETWRSMGIGLVLAAAVAAFFVVLYNLQIVHGAEYRQQAQRKIADTETVDAARGELLDRYGRVLVSNRTTYEVTLDASLMGADRDATLTALLDICREQGVTWQDTLPISAEAPYVFTVDQYTSATTLNRLTGLMEKLKVEDSGLQAQIRAADRAREQAAAAAEAAEAAGEPAPTEPIALPQASADAVMNAFAQAWKVDRAALEPAQFRRLMGVLYEVMLRSREVTWTEYVFAQDVDITFISRVKEQGLAGVQISAATARTYRTSAAAHLLGRVGKMDETEWETYRELGYAMDGTVGKSGMEAAFESRLHGAAGTRAVERDAAGKLVYESYLEEPQPGTNVVTTLDIGLQAAVEKILARRVPEMNGAQGAAAVLVQVGTGDVLTAASYPGFDPGIYADSAAYAEAAADPLKPFYNRATQGLYAPGSTFKPCVAVAALEEGIITPSTEILDTGRYLYYKDYQPKCWIYRQHGVTHGLENVSEAIRDSCNVFFYDIGRRMGIGKMAEYAAAFGLGQRTGIEVPEKAGVMAGPEYTESLGGTWYEGNVLPAAIGQENSQFTPLQLANYIAALVDGGEHYRAHLLSAAMSGDYSAVLEENAAELLNTVEMKDSTVEAVKKGMLALTQEGGSLCEAFKDLGVRVGAKTGSAQVSASTNSNAVLVCFAPYDDPQVALAIVVEHGGSGSELGAMGAEILDSYFSAQARMNALPAENALLP